MFACLGSQQYVRLVASTRAKARMILMCMWMHDFSISTIYESRPTLIYRLPKMRYNIIPRLIQFLAVPYHLFLSGTKQSHQNPPLQSTKLDHHKIKMGRNKIRSLLDRHHDRTCPKVFTLLCPMVAKKQGNGNKS